MLATRMSPVWMYTGVAALGTITISGCSPAPAWCARADGLEAAGAGDSVRGRGPRWHDADSLGSETLTDSAAARAGPHDTMTARALALARARTAPGPAGLRLAGGVIPATEAQTEETASGKAARRPSRPDSDRYQAQPATPEMTGRPGRDSERRPGRVKRRLAH